MTTQASTATVATRLQALFSALVVTLAMLSGINGIAVSEVASAQTAVHAQSLEA